MVNSGFAPLPISGYADARDVDSLQRGLEILRLFHPPQTSLSISEISARLGIPRTTVQRLAETLVEHGFLRSVSGGDRYQPDTACLLLGHAVLASSAIGRIARPILDETVERLGGHLVLGQRDRISMLCLVCAAGRETAPINLLGAGFCVPMTGTALGRAWLWSQPASMQGELIQRTKDETGDQGARTIPALYRAFQELEEDGFCISIGEWQRDVAAVGTAVRLSNGQSFGLSHKIARSVSRVDLKTHIGAPLLAVAARIQDAAARHPMEYQR